MNLIREIKVCGRQVQEFETHGEFIVFVNGYPVNESYQECVKAIVEHDRRNATADEKRIRELIGSEFERRAQARMA